MANPSVNSGLLSAAMQAYGALWLINKALLISSESVGIYLGKYI